MNMKWIEPKMPEFEYGKLPSVWISALVFVGFFTLCFVLTVLTWKQGKPVMSVEFFARILLVPALLGGLIGSMIYVPYEDWIARVDLWNNLCQRTYANWRWWAQDRVAIIGSVTLTPEKDLGVRVLGLEGSPPANADKALALAPGKKEGSMSRTQQVLEQLVTPFAPAMTDFIGRHTFSIILHSDREEDLNDLRSLLRQLAPRDFGFVQITQVTEAIDMDLIDNWLSGNGAPDYCLVLAYQLHTMGEEPTCSEAAVSVLFASRAVIANSKGKLRPEAWIFRPAAAAMDLIFDTLKTMLAAQQTPVERIKHLWLTHIPSQGKHATLTAVKDTNLNVVAHDLDIAIGSPGPVNTLLVQALAASMVQHGQGTQMVATPHEAGVMLNLVGTSIAPIENVELLVPTMTSISFTCMTACLGGLIMLACTDGGASAGWFIGVLAGFIVLLLVAAFFSLVRRNQVTEDFHRALPW
jgi:hypothetical protein